MHSLHYREVNVVSNYQTQLTPAYTKPAEALWQQQQIADTETQLLRLPILHDALFSFFFFPLDSKQDRVWLGGEPPASQGLPMVVKERRTYAGRINEHIANILLSYSRAGVEVIAHIALFS